MTRGNPVFMAGIERINKMKKCRYSVDGNCTNDDVACEKCSSTELELKNCIPFQQCIILQNDNWGVELEKK